MVKLCDKILPAFRYRNALITVITQFLIAFATAFLFWYLPIKINELQGVLAVGLMYSVARILSALLSPLGGVASDVYGRKPLTILGPLMYALVFLSLLGSIKTIWVTVVLLVVVPSIVSNSVYLITLENVGDKDRGVVMSFVNIAFAAAMALGNILLPMMYSAMGIAPVVMLGASLCVLSSLLRIAYDETLREREVGKPFIARFYDGLRGLLPKGLRVVFVGYVAYLTLFGILATLGSEVVSRFIPIYLRDILGLRLTSIGLLYSLISFINIASYMLGGILSRKLGYAHLVVASSLIIALCLLALATFKSVYAAITLFIALSISESIAQVAIPPLYVKALDRYPDRKATVMHTQSSLSIATTFFAPLLGALIWLLSPDLLLITSSIIFVSSGLILIPLIKQFKTIHKDSAER